MITPSYDVYYIVTPIIIEKHLTFITIAISLLSIKIDINQNPRFFYLIKIKKIRDKLKPIDQLNIGHTSKLRFLYLIKSNDLNVASIVLFLLSCRNNNHFCIVDVFASINLINHNKYSAYQSP